MSEDYEYRIWQASEKIKKLKDENTHEYYFGDRDYVKFSDTENKLNKILRDLGRY